MTVKVHNPKLAVAVMAFSVFLGTDALGQLDSTWTLILNGQAVQAEPDGDVALLYRDAARHLAARLWAQDAQAPQISISDD